ncbi:2-phospho-L-lactate guanylyltransferase [Modestobacter italicus]|uniref:2-phospho-L-lactate guanylyltransferase n=1 Tax=Modestobacter italicus (strain DSM 44449 / CECT 9708 / BC 501) TaxID=2732864 RepID=UPI001C93D171|nr:2-phospho-L-lactate guanylyltransferase [Modestobacter italicus]
MQPWSVVVPAKRLESAKTRLASLTGPLAGGSHEQLVLALLADTVSAALASPAVGRVLVVTDDPRAAALVAALGARTTPDEPRSGLNAALAHGARVAGPGPLAALHSDLPALHPDELDAALTAAAGHVRSFVPDAAGTGTTLLAVRSGDLAPRFGPGSAAAHATGGAIPLDGDWPGLRQDVDTPADLRAARRIGVGQRTAGFLSATRWTPG